MQKYAGGCEPAYGLFKDAGGKGKRSVQKGEKGNRDLEDKKKFLRLYDLAYKLLKFLVGHADEKW